MSTSRIENFNQVHRNGIQTSSLQCGQAQPPCKAQTQSYPCIERLRWPSWLLCSSNTLDSSPGCSPRSTSQDSPLVLRTLLSGTIYLRAAHPVISFLEHPRSPRKTSPIATHLPLDHHIRFDQVYKHHVSLHTVRLSNLRPLMDVPDPTLRILPRSPQLPQPSDRPNTNCAPNVMSSVQRCFLGCRNYADDTRAVGMQPISSKSLWRQRDNSGSLGRSPAAMG